MDYRNLPDNFQRLTDEDESLYGTPEFLCLNPPVVADSLCMLKRQNWIDWRAAPYPAKRHSEYLYIPALGKSSNAPKILLSAVLETPNSIEEYVAISNRKRRYDILGRKAISRGYYAKPIVPAEQSGPIWEVIHSSDTRQGRGIASMFADRPKDFSFPDYIEYAEEDYRDICCGVFSESGDLAAYLLGKRVGDHVQYHEIMGHKDHVGNDVMYLLHIKFLELCTQLPNRPKCLNYGSWYSGQNPFSPEGGLNRWKRKTHFKPAYLILASS